MITDTIINMTLGVFNFFLGLLPSWGPDMTEFSQVGTGLGNVFFRADGWFPVKWTFTCVAIVVGVQAGAIGWRLIVFIWELLPFKAT